MYDVSWDPEAIEELTQIPIFHRRRIFDAVARELAVRPKKPPQKQIIGLAASWGDRESFWQLTVEPYRVFYDVFEDPREVVVQAVRYKGRKRTKEIL